MQSHQNEKLSFSFACGGWLKMYLFGVAKALQESDLEKNARMIGSSAGALAATGLALGCDFEKIRDHVVDRCVPQVHSSFFGAFRVREFLIDTIRSTSDLSRYQELNESDRIGSLTIVYSSLSARKSRRATTFTSEDHLEKCLIASCTASPIVGMPFKLDGEYVMDGAVFDFQPIIDKNTIRISPFYCTDADIRPSQYVPIWWAVYPPSQDDVRWLFDLGYADGLAWISRSGMSKEGISKRSNFPHRGKNASVGRLFGYQLGENRLVQMMLLGFYISVWKPATFFLLYMELYLQSYITGCRAVFYKIAGKRRVLALFTIVALVVFLEGKFPLFIAICGAFVLALSLAMSCGYNEGTRVGSDDWEKCRACLRNIASLSLFLRAIPILGSSVQVKRHHFLLEHSFVYRVAHHWV
uniref:Patatinlike phospholipase putative n=1 Tax=Albugo laibachii Nc14 TaxID=890382 RepID=F0WMG3_9STRA|nr:patatinlike phospholipase putative [Albugo laibachii Nc14]|eukprot:CCA22495.1 patatinlike phospholipase putative [Albugo laibachii Nc14]